MKSKKYIRPEIHFSPRKGWMNDPNGPVFYKGEYHLFFQHNPNDVYWDSMHWGHAKSKDLVYWEEQPIALYPDEQGMIFSGSAIVDKTNITGFGSKEDSPLLLFYTSHKGDTSREMQCLAYTTDCEHFFKYGGNPIIPGQDNTPARDPYVFENEIIGGYSLCLTVEKAIEFYHSDNLIDWNKTGEFRLPEYALQGMIECPCIFKDKKYVFMMSMDIPDSEFSKLPGKAAPHNRLMQYFVGDFDGYSFTASADQKEALLVDYGPDFYAGTIFSNVKDTILIAWLGNFSKATETAPTVKEGFKGIMSYPRKLELKMTKDGYRLSSDFYPIPRAYGNFVYREIGDEKILRDGCVTERIKENGLISYSAYEV